MIISRNSLLIVAFLFLNSLDILYLVAFKLALPVATLYLILVVAVMAFVVCNLGKHNKQEMYTFLVCISYFLVKLIHGVLSADEFLYSFVTFISFSFTILLAQFSIRIKQEELFELIQKLFFLTVFLYVVVDFLSIILMGKSQHVIMSNIAPFLLLTALTIFIGREKNRLLPLFVMFSFICWIAVSAFSFTLDQRLQIKAVALVAILAVFFVFCVLFNSFIRKLRGRILSTSSLSASAAVLFIIFLSVSVSIFILFNEQITSARDASMGLREQVTLKMLQEVFYDGKIWSTLFGHGLGSSMKEFHVVLGNYDMELRSHSGLLSLLYEHGLVSVFLYLLLLAFAFIRLKEEGGKGQSNKYRFVTFFLLLTLVVYWTILNAMYLIAINVPNFGHQTQLISSLFLVVYLNRQVFQKNTPNLNFGKSL